MYNSWVYSLSVPTLSNASIPLPLQTPSPEKVGRPTAEEELQTGMMNDPVWGPIMMEEAAEKVAAAARAKVSCLDLTLFEAVASKNCMLSYLSCSL